MQLDQGVNHVAILIHRTPQIVLVAVDADKDLV
jgi:hypothetical protein